MIARCSGNGSRCTTELAPGDALEVVFEAENLEPARFSSADVLDLRRVLVEPVNVAAEAAELVSPNNGN